MIFHTLRRITCLTAVAVAASLLGFASPAHAQNARGDAQQQGQGQRGGGMLMRAVEQFRTLLGDLKLTDEQKSQTDTILRTAREEMQAAMQDTNSEPRERMQAVRAKFEEAQTKVRDVLTDDQKTAFDTGLESIRQDMQRSTTQPGGGRGMQLVARLERALSTVELTDEQKPRIQAVLDATTEKLSALREEARASGDPASIREKVMALREEAQGKLGEILTTEQATKLREAINADRPNGPGVGPGNGPRDRGTQRPPADGENKPVVQNEAGSTGLLASAGKIAPINLGEKLPPFSLLQLSGKPFNNESLAGRPTVIFFGSYSSPATRDRIGKLQELAEKNRSRAKFVLIYTAEMYPSDAEQPARNTAEKISVAAHKTMDDRSAAARTARDALKIKLDIAADTMESTLQNTLGVAANGAAIVLPDGTLRFRQDWAEPFAIERALVDAISASK